MRPRARQTHSNHPLSTKRKTKGRGATSESEKTPAGKTGEKGKEHVESGGSPHAVPSSSKLLLPLSGRLIPIIRED